MSDRLGGARVTLAVFLGEAVFTLTAILGVNEHSFPVFFGSFMAIFLLAGMGNGSTYRMIPSIFSELGRKEAAEKGLDEKTTVLDFKRQAAAVIGIAGAIGAFGGFLIQVIFRQASLGVSAGVTPAHTPAEKLSVAQSMADWSIPALWVFLGAYMVFAGMTWFFYLRKSFATDKIASLARASV
jgi:NNP family nitrate/nitrite transporter-like MFS transporter